MLKIVNLKIKSESYLLHCGNTYKIVKINKKNKSKIIETSENMLD
jgi:hypothetical protein